MYAKTVKSYNPAMSLEDAEAVVEYMRENVSPTLCHLPREAFKDALIECYTLKII